MPTRFSLRVLLISLTIIALCLGLVRFVWNKNYSDGFYDGLVYRIIGTGVYSGAREDNSVPFRPGYSTGLNDGLAAIPFDIFAPGQVPESASEYARMTLAWSKTAQGIDHATRQTILRVAQTVIQNPDAAYSRAHARTFP
jgi:hypothetical protein